MTLLLIHAAATWFMTGLVWFVQVVHYPLFAGVGAAEFARYAQSHSQRTTWVVMPVMLIELAATVALLLTPPAARAAVPVWMTWAGAGLLAIVWLSTFLLQVPRHEELAAGFQVAAHSRLVATNWIRTAAWTGRGILSLLMLK